MKMTDTMIVTAPDILGATLVIKGTRMPVDGLAASVRAGTPRDHILAVYPTIREYHLDLVISYTTAHPLN